MAMRRVHTSIGKEWEGMNPDNADFGLVCLFAVLDVYHPLQKRSKTVCTVYPKEHYSNHTVASCRWFHFCKHYTKSIGNNTSSVHAGPSKLPSGIGNCNTPPAAEVMQAARQMAYWGMPCRNDIRCRACILPTIPTPERNIFSVKIL